MCTGTLTPMLAASFNGNGVIIFATISPRMEAFYLVRRVLHFSHTYIPAFLGAF